MWPPSVTSSASDWEDSCNNPASLWSSCASVVSAIDPVDLLERDGFQNNYQAWPLSEDLVKDEMLFLSPYAFDSATAREEPQVTGHQTRNTNTTLTPEEEDRLLRIAMPSKKQPQSPIPVLAEGYHVRRPKWKLFDTAPTKERTKQKGVLSSKKAHNLIEKRYRTNLNQKIAALRDVIPNLREIAEESKDTEDLEVRLSIQKINKSTILSEAREYILDLEKHNESFIAEMKTLQARIVFFQTLATLRSNGTWASVRG